MNKFIVAAILIVVAGTAITSASPSVAGLLRQPADDETIDQLVDEMEASSAPNGEAESVDPNAKKEHLFFKDYCTQSTDMLKAFLKQKVGGATASIYGVIFNSINEIGSEVLQAQAQATQEGTSLLDGSNPEAAAASSDGEGSSAEELSYIGKVKNAVGLVASKMYSTSKDLIMQRMAALKENYSPAVIKATIEDVCVSISGDLQRKLESKLAETKTQLKKELGKSEPEMLTFIQKAKMSDVGCTLTSRVSKVSKACDMFKLVGPSIASAFGYDA